MNLETLVMKDHSSRKNKIKEVFKYGTSWFQIKGALNQLEMPILIVIPLVESYFFILFLR